MTMEDKEKFADVVLSNKGSNTGGDGVKSYYYKPKTSSLDFKNDVNVFVILGYSMILMDMPLDSEVVPNISSATLIGYLINNIYVLNNVVKIKLLDVPTTIMEGSVISLKGNLTQRLVCVGFDEQTAQSMVDNYFIEITEEEYNNL
jgi:hypothetical protein